MATKGVYVQNNYKRKRVYEIMFIKSFSQVTVMILIRLTKQVLLS